MARSKQPSRNRITQAKRIMMLELRECGFACSCGESRYRGRPCAICRMAAFIKDIEPYVMCVKNEFWKGRTG